MSSEQVLDLFSNYEVLRDEIKEHGARSVLDDLMAYYPDIYFALEKEFKHREKIRQLGVLLTKDMGC